MIEQITLPEELNLSLGSESRDFAVRGCRAKPVGFSQGGFKQVISEINDANEGNSQQSAEKGSRIMILHHRPVHR